VGEANQLAIRRALNIPQERDFTSYETLGNTGTVALPLTAAIADQAGFLQTGDKVAFLGIGSGLNCMMLGIEW
jgi:3-oxoacyl-[acyl-carrier-protein] synthase-3